jgi:hypothetical protein
MIVDHLASPAVAGFSVSKIKGQGPLLQPATSRCCDLAAQLQINPTQAARQLAERARLSHVVG